MLELFVLSMNWISVGVIWKNEMLIVAPGESDGNFWPNRSATRAICSPLSSAEHSPTPWTPRVWLRSVVYSSIVNATIGF